jgi:GAF domain-containing protein
MASVYWYVKAIEQLSSIAKQLALATDFEGVARLINHALGELLSADDSSLVLRYGDQCYCLPEPDQDIFHDGQLLPLHLCNSGWAMLNRRIAVCHDIDLDERFQFGADRHTRAKSLMIVPLGHPRPLAAISTYWLQKHESSD